MKVKCFLSQIQVEQLSKSRVGHKNRMNNFHIAKISHHVWGKVFKNGPSNICGIKTSKNFTWYIFEYFVAYV